VLVANAGLPPARTDEGVRALLAASRRWPRAGVLVYSAAPGPRIAAELFAAADTGPGIGYLLLEHFIDAGELMDALTRIATGGTVVDPRIVSSLALADTVKGGGGLGTLSDRELEVLRLMAQGRTNGAIAHRLSVSAGIVEKRVAAVFAKLDIPGTRHDNRRVLAVLRYLAGRPEPIAEHRPSLALAGAA
jgi:DNA-binding NarL/FixJ family response regulator